ncbi:MAG: hypothetical protein AB1696_22885 [Planctomycetota bacterium]
MKRETGKKAYRKPTLKSERVFEQAALSCIPRDLGTAGTTSLKVSTTVGGCRFVSS